MTDSFDKHSLKGHILLAMPNMEDEVFGRAAIFICSHNKEGAVGIIVNRPLESVTFLELLTQFHIKSPQKFKNRPVFFGGPVDVNRGFILHSTDQMLESSIEINSDIALTVNLNFFRELLTEDLSKDLLVSLGYAGWGEGQLEQEIRSGNWLHVSATKEMLFADAHEEKWQKAFDELGVDPAYLAPRTGNA